MITVTPITRVQAVRLAGCRVPFGMRFYLLTNVEFYPAYGDWSYTWAGGGGLIAVVGKRKTQAKALAA